MLPSVFTPYSDEKGATLVTTLVGPNGEKLDMSKRKYPGKFPIGEKEVPSTTYHFPDPAVGSYTLTLALKIDATLEGSLLARLASSSTVMPPHGETLVWNESPYTLHAHLKTYKTVMGSATGLMARLTKDPVVDGEEPVACQGVVKEAMLDITSPDGTESLVTCTCPQARVLAPGTPRLTHPFGAPFLGADA